MKNTKRYLLTLVCASIASTTCAFIVRQQIAGLTRTVLEAEKKKVVVIGNGMVGQRFMENLLKLDQEKQCQIATFCEEPRAA
jgi:hypothetical protein